MASRKKLTPLELASQLREAAKNPMDPSLRKLIKKAVDMLIDLSKPPQEADEFPSSTDRKSEETFFSCCDASTQGPHTDGCTRPTMAERANDSP